MQERRLVLQHCSETFCTVTSEENPDPGKLSVHSSFMISETRSDTIIKDCSHLDIRVAHQLSSNGETDVDIFWRK